jgi:heavy metal translocating P-type ATPase
MESPPTASAGMRSWIMRCWARRTVWIAILAMAAIVAHLVIRWLMGGGEVANWPLWVALAVGGTPLVLELTGNLFRGEFGSDLLAGISIVTSVILGEYLAGVIVVLMLSGGQTLEGIAVRHASSVLRILASRMPSIAHRKTESGVRDVAVSEIRIGDTLVVYPHEICPVDGTVVEGMGVMNEAYLTGEPFQITKVPGTEVISGAVNGESALTIAATKRAEDSRYAKIMEVMRESQENRPRLRRLGDQLGAVYTPLAVGVAVAAWLVSGEAVRFLAVLVVATPCPLLIAIPVSIIGSISLCARRSIIVKKPTALEQITSCRTAIFDKTGTLTYGAPKLVEEFVLPGFDPLEVLTLVGSLEEYSKHPLAKAIHAAVGAKGLALLTPSRVSEAPGHGLRGWVNGREIWVTHRRGAAREGIAGVEKLPAEQGGLECVIVIDGEIVAAYRFRDAPRSDSRSFVGHLGPKHQFDRVLIVSGDRSAEVQYLAEQVGIKEVYSEQTPEQKLKIVRQESAKAKVLYVGDGINDAPAMMAATIGMSIGQNSDVTAEAADVVVMENSLKKVDEFMHIGRHMKSVALQSAIGGMLLSVVGMGFAAAGYLDPVAGALFQEVIDVLAVVNALRAAMIPKVISDVPVES